MADVKYYLDENIPTAIAEQLRLRGIDAVHVYELGVGGDSDMNHLIRASSQERVMCTFDIDFVIAAQQYTDHMGIILGHPLKHGIGIWVSQLVLYHGVYTSDEMRGRLEYR
jgi:hypothetical protein